MFFQGKPDRYSGISVRLCDNQSLFRNPPLDTSTEISLSEFQKCLGSVLAASLDQWRSDGVRGVWFHVPLSWDQEEDPETSSSTSSEDDSAISFFSPGFILPLLSEHSFRFHHARGSVSVLTLWLPDPTLKTTPIPEYARTSIGVGGLVLNVKSVSGDEPDQRKNVVHVLLIREKHGYRPTWWKLPGGALDSGERLWDTAVREIEEETGVRTEYVDMLGFRHLHNFRWGDIDDFYFVCVLVPKKEKKDGVVVDSDSSSSLPSIVADPQEVAECRWVPVEEWFSWGVEKVGAGENQLIRLAVKERLANLVSLIEKSHQQEEEEEGEGESEETMPSQKNARIIMPKIDFRAEESRSGRSLVDELLRNGMGGDLDSSRRRRATVWPIQYTPKMTAEFFQLL